MREEDLPEKPYEYSVITAVEPYTDGSGWSLSFKDTGIGLQKCAVEPKVGMRVGFIGRGFGYPVRGMTFDGVVGYYRTEEEEKLRWEHRHYGKDAADYLRMWDEGETIPFVVMGGLGPGYEQCIVITMMEHLRWMLVNKPDVGSVGHDPEAQKRMRDAIAASVGPRLSYLGLSGNQWSAAMSLAWGVYSRGPAKFIKMYDELKDENRVQRTSRNMPQAPEVPG